MGQSTAIIPKVTVIDPLPQDAIKLRVAAYARVSTDSEDQVNSYLAQVDHYSKFITANPEWEMVDIYADEGFSGLETRKRDEFNRMIADCRAGKIDRVLVKSFSRFARNAKEQIQYIRELLRLGITIYFEKENLDTGKMTSEQVADMYSAFAQMESTNHSHNMRVSIRFRMESGTYVSPVTPFGYRLKNLEPVIVPEEAEVVRSIFRAYLSGRGMADIAADLNANKAYRGKDRERWFVHTIQYILTNPAYTGDAVWNRKFRSDTVPFPTVWNKGQRPMYHAEGTHPPLVTKEEFQRTQELIAKRREQFRNEATASESPLLRHIFCGTCGSLCRRKINNGIPYWICRGHDTNRESCSMTPIPEERIFAALLRCRNKLYLYKDLILRPMLRQFQDIRELELRSNKKITDIDREIARVSEQNHVLVSLKAKGCIDSALYSSQLDALQQKLKDLRLLRRRTFDTASDNQQIRDTETMLDELENGPEWLEGVTADLFKTIVKSITMESVGRIRICLLNGLEVTETLER